MKLYVKKGFKEIVSMVLAAVLLCGCSQGPAPEFTSGPDAELEQLADAVLRRILPAGATAQEQVECIYAWARQELCYTNHFSERDWHKAAYLMLTQYHGDCFGYFAVTKLLLERLGIPNIDVRKVKNFEGDSDHFWSLVSVDGGKSYYHFDATPRIGEGDDFCLVTDGFLDAYSAAHKNSHHRNPALYPQTPVSTLK